MKIGGVNMSKEKAKDFLKYLKDNPDVADKMKGFTLEEFKEAADEYKAELSSQGEEDFEPHFPT